MQINAFPVEQPCHYDESTVTKASFDPTFCVQSESDRIFDDRCLVEIDPAEVANDLR